MKAKNDEKKYFHKSFTAFKNVANCHVFLMYANIINL